LRVLVTGGAGFIGSNFIRYFLGAHPDAEIINLDKLTYAGNPENLTQVVSHANYEFVLGDVCDATLVVALMKRGPDAVVHFAAETHVDRSIEDAQEFIRTNVQGTHTLLEAARRCGITRFLHVSTDEVYGSLQPGESASEQSPYRPNSPYAASKAASDLIVRSYWKTYGFPAITTRCSNNYGPNQFPEKLVPLMISNALEGKKLPVYGDGLNERDWIYVEDHCRALDVILNGGRPGEVYNIGLGSPVSNLDIVRRLLQILGKPENLIEFVADRPGHDRRYALDTTKIAAELGWRPAIDLEEGLRRTVNWYVANPDWIRKVRSAEYLKYYDKFYRQREQTLSDL
jgi:dTDP-glucose 4,6-dehydratase